MARECLRIGRADHRRERGNAGLHLLDPDELTPGALGPRVRVNNTTDALRERFTLSWRGPEEPSRARNRSKSTSPGQSRTVRIPLPAAPGNADRLVLQGDDSGFDNTHFAIPPVREPQRVVYVGTDQPNDPDGLLYYLQRALWNQPGLR